MKVAYLVHFRGGSESGILRNVASQAAAWTQLGAEVGLFVATSPAAVPAWSALPEAIVVRTPPNGPFAMLREREALIRDIARWRPDVVYLRHGLVHPGLIRLARLLPSVVEVNGDDLAEFRLTSTRRYLLARATRGFLLRRAAGLVFVTHELAAMPVFAAYGRPGIVIGNGIDLSTVEPAPPSASEVPRLIFVGHPHTPRHGLDQLESLAAACPGWRIDLIGPGPDENSATLPNLVAHGALEPPDYRQLLNEADIAVGSLALCRAGLNEACTLKVRECLAAGLPIVMGYHDTDFLDGAPFILRIPNEPDGVRASVESIRTFVEGWRGRRVPRDLVAHLDVAVKEGARFRFLESAARG